MITPRIHLVAYDDREPWFIFVAVPNERGRYLRTDKSVSLVACPMCKAAVGEPCISRGKPGDPFNKYSSTTHHVRRMAARGEGRGSDVLETHPATPDEIMEAAA